MTAVAAVVNVFKAPSLKAGLPSGGGVTKHFPNKWDSNLTHSQAHGHRSPPADTCLSELRTRKVFNWKLERTCDTVF